MKRGIQQGGWNRNPNRSLGGDICFPSKIYKKKKTKNAQKSDIGTNKKKKKTVTEDRWPGGWGHEFSQPKENEWLQIYLQPNGINLDNNIDDTKIKIALKKMKEMGAGQINMPETNIDWKITKVREEFGYRMRTHWNVSRNTFATSKVGARGDKFLPGGVASMVVGKWTGRCLDAGQDPTGMGRWTWQKIRGKGEHIITQITAYRVPQESPPGPTTAYMQQWDHMIAQGIENPDPKKQFLTDLEAFINKLRKKGESIILAVDANEPLVDPARPEKTTGIRKLLQKCNLTDVFEYHHADMCGDTSERKYHKIDHVAVSQKILPAVKKCGFLPRDEICDTDHRSGFVLWDSAELLGPEDDLTPPEKRKLILAYPDRVNKYKEFVLGKFREQKLSQALKDLQHRVHQKGTWTKKMEKKYNNLDKKMTKIMLDGEKQCLHIRERNTPWSTKLMSESYKLYYWSLKISSLKRYRKSTLRRLKKAAEKSGIQDRIMTLREAKEERAKARENMKKS